MTAATPPPPRDGEVCTCGHELRFHGECLGERTICTSGDGCTRYRPAAPSEPPATDSPTPGTETCPNGCHLDHYGTHQGPPDCDRLPRDPNWNNPNPAGPTERLVAPSPVDTTEPLAEQAVEAITAQFDEWEVYCRGISNDELAREAVRLAARPSADTEKLRRVRELADALATTPRESQWLHLDALRAALDAR